MSAALRPRLLAVLAATGGGAQPSCLPDCNVANLVGADLRFANMADANLARADLSDTARCYRGRCGRHRG